tara:strand:- start:43 stop:996 length:954 start_codon:yes stop_codon:yes gene_type:complete
MATLLDYYNQNPQLFAENEHLLAKDPIYNLGLMDLGAMHLYDRARGKYHIPSGLESLLGGKKRYKAGTSGVLGAYNPFPETKRGIPSQNIGIYTGPFTKDDTPTYWDDPDIGNPPSEMRNLPISNLDKARVIAHEMRHKLIEEDPELHNLQPDWTGLYVQSDDPDAEQTWFQRLFGQESTAEKKAAKKQHWRNEAFNRFLDFRNFPDIQWRGKSATRYPRGLSSPNLKPTDMYFDKIWRDKWEPHAKEFDKKIKEIAAKRNVPGTPIVPMDRGRGRDEPSRPSPSRSRDRGRSRSKGETGKIAGGHHFKYGGIVSVL